ncbi:uncharacterized protein LOC134767723 [Penaeus indicus]|uniref:uncharacterized protein LOC134767723 n=1 Tax=Penaeus indicus TaxID=29960 RepID=UPI00300C9A61
MCRTAYALLLSVAMCLQLAAASSQPLWHEQSVEHESQDVEDSLVPIVFLPLASHRPSQPLLRSSSQKRNSEILNTLLGSEALGAMRNAGRR